jgi:hypothetical protein
LPEDDREVLASMMLVQRLRSRARLLAATAMVVGLAAGLTSGLSTIAQATVVDGARAAISEARGDDTVVRVAIRWAGQSGSSEADAARAADEQDAAVREAIAAIMPSAVFTPKASIRSEPLNLDGLAASLVLVSDERLLDRVDIVGGAWPAAAREGALHVAAAEALDIGIGDRVALPGVGEDPVEVTVTALWQARDGGDPAWGGDPLAERGIDGLTAGPLVVDQTLWRMLATRPIAQWNSVLEPAAVTPAVLDEIAAALPSLADVIDDDDRSRGTGIVVDGGLQSTVAEVRRASAGVAAILPVALALVGLAALTTLLELQRLLATVRRDETTLLRSRGASPRRLTANAAIESLVISLPAAVAGALAGTALAFGARPGSLERGTVDLAPLILTAGASALAVTLTTVLLALVVASRSARRALRRDTLIDSGRQTQVVSAAALLLSLLGAGVSVSQFVLHRGPIVPTAGGGTAVDPIAALAPVLLLLAGALLAVVLVEPLARLVARAAAGSDRLSPMLIAHPLARSAAIVTAPVLLIGLAVGGLVVAAAVDTTTRSSERSARELTLGAAISVSGGVLDADARANLGAGGALIELAGRAWTGAPVALAELSLAESPGTLVAIDASAVSEIAAPAGGAVDGDRIAAAIAPEPLPSIEIAATATSIRLAGADDGVRAAFWVADAQGGVTRIASDDAGVAALPDLGGPWRVIALDVSAFASGRELDVVLSGVIATDADGAENVIDFDELWVARPGVISGFVGEVVARGDGRSGFTATVDRVAPGDVRITPEPTTLRLAVTEAAAERFGAVTGDRITVDVAGSGRELVGVVTDIVPAIPGASTTSAVAVDLAAAAQSQLAEAARPLGVSAVWLAPVDGAEVDAASRLDAAAELRRIAPSGSSVDAVADAPAGALAEGARTALWSAALGAFVLALAAAAIVSRAIGGVREADVVVLRAIGVRSRVQARARAVEFAGVLAAATAGGLVVGAAATLLLVGDLARALLVDAPPALRLTGTVEPVLAVAVAMLLLAAIATLGIGAGRHAARQTRSLSAREVLR